MTFEAVKNGIWRAASYVPNIIAYPVRGIFLIILLLVLSIGFVVENLWSGIKWFNWAVADRHG